MHLMQYLTHTKDSVNNSITILKGILNTYFILYPLKIIVKYNGIKAYF